VIAISGYATKEIVNFIAVAGADVFIEMPVKIEELQAVERRFM
jgi:CheY-like chemotaxis protein